MSSRGSFCGISVCTHLESCTHPADLVVSRRGGAGDGGSGGGSARDGGGHINNYPWRRGVGKTRCRASGERGMDDGREKEREREREKTEERKRDEVGGNGAERRGKLGWKKRGRDGRRYRRRKEESRVNRGQVAPPDASRVTTLLRPLVPSHPNDPATLLPLSPSRALLLVPPLPPPLTSHAALLRALSKPPPRFYLRFLLAARAARGGWWLVGWVVNHPRATFGSHARTTAPRPTSPPVRSGLVRAALRRSYAV